MRDERAHVLRMLRDKRQRIHRAAAAREQVDRTAADRGDDPMDVVTVDVGCHRAAHVVLHAALAAARVVGHDRAIGEVP